jgi:hypothetical protein
MVFATTGGFKSLIQDGTKAQEVEYVLGTRIQSPRAIKVLAQ